MTTPLTAEGRALVDACTQLMTPESNVIEFTRAELTQGALGGVMRQVINIFKKRQPGHGKSPGKNDWQIHIEGCLAEMAVAKYLKVYGGGIGRFRGPDVAGQFEVKSTRRENGCLIVHPAMNPDLKCILVTGENGVYTIQGWQYAGKAMQIGGMKHNQRDKTERFVEQEDLEPMSTLRD